VTSTPAGWTTPGTAAVPDEALAVAVLRLAAAGAPADAACATPGTSAAPVAALAAGAALWLGGGLAVGAAL